MWLAIAAGAWIWIGGIAWVVMSSDDEDAAMRVARVEDEAAQEDAGDDEAVAADRRVAAETARRAKARAARKRAAREAEEQGEAAAAAAAAAAEAERAAEAARRAAAGGGAGKGAGSASKTEVGEAETRAERELRESDEVNKLLADLAAAKANQRGPEVDPRAGLPQSLNSGILASTLRRQRRQFTACYRKQVAEPNGMAVIVMVSLVISSDGTVSTAKVDSGPINDAVKGCLVATLKAMKFPEFRDLSQGVTYPINLR